MYIELIYELYEQISMINFNNGHVPTVVESNNCYLRNLSRNVGSQTD